jgi:hypothetical protein
MKCRTLGAQAAVFCFAAAIKAVAIPASDVNSPQKRQATLDLAQQLTQQATTAAATAVSNPFNPPDFEGPGQDPNVGKPTERKPGTPAAIRSDREILELLASRIPATGTLTRDNKVFLSVGRRQLEPGQKVLLSEAGQNYEVELVAVTATHFTVRFRDMEFSRPIALAR